VLRSELERASGRAIQLKDLSVLRWTDSADTMVATFGEVADGARTGTRQAAVLGPPGPAMENIL
jgi:hypothetical protein